MSEYMRKKIYKYAIFDKSNLKGTATNLKDTRRKAYQYCTNSSPRIQIYKDAEMYGNDLFYWNVKYTVIFERIYEGRKVIFFKEEGIEQPPRRITATGEFYRTPKKMKR